MIIIAEKLSKRNALYAFWTLIATIVADLAWIGLFYLKPGVAYWSQIGFNSRYDMYYKIFEYSTLGVKVLVKLFLAFAFLHTENLIIA